MSTPAEDAAAATAALVAALTGPAKVASDAGSVEQRPLADLIALDRYLAGKAAIDTPTRGLRFNRLVPDGTVNRRHYRGSDDPNWRNV